MATSNGSANSPERWLPELADSGITALRGFSKNGDLARRATDRGLAATGFLTWSADAEELSFPVDDLAGWRAYVDRTVRAQPRVRQWEVWNEPPNFTDNPSPAAYARLVQVAYETIKSIDGGLQVGLAAKSTHLSFMADALDAGAAGHYDYVTLHPYERLEQLFDGWDENFLAIVGQTRAMLAAHDPDRRDVPIDFTEIGWPAAGLDGPDPDAHLTPVDQADVLVKAYTLALAQGVRRAYWYDVWDGDAPAGERPYGLVAADGAPRPSYSALKNLVDSLGAQPRFTAVRAIGPTATILEFSTPQGPLLVAWSQDGATLRLRNPARARSVTGRARARARAIRLSTSPLIVPTTGGGAYTWAPRRPVTATRASRSGSYDVAWSAGTGSTGLLVRGGVLTTADGRPVRDMSSSTSLDMALVPPAPAWTRVRLQVKITARATGKDAGFGLRYDAGPDVTDVDDAGQAADPWRRIPAGTWRTFTWNVSSVRPVGVFGANLRLVSDSKAHSRYVVSDVRVHVEPAP